MNSLKIIKQMLKLQKQLNDDTNGKNWEEGYNNLGKLINWKRCIYMECAELIDNFAWKHWKDVSKPTNWENVRIEIVDIWHFILSLMLEKNQDIDKISNEIISMQGFRNFCLEPYNPDEYSIYEIINDIEFIINKCSGFNVEISEIMTAFFRLCWKCGINLQTLFEIYIGKNILNEFRQKHGYKEGRYIKIWNGKEDNDYLSLILEKGVVDSKEIYKELEKEYKLILSKNK